MADSDNKHVEIDEVQEFGGGEIKSIEPIAEGDTEHGVHGAFHAYGGGQVLEHTDTSISPIMWVFWATVILVVFGVAIGLGFIPEFRPFSNEYNRPKGATTPGYIDAQRAMQSDASFAAMTSPDLINMYELPRPAGQNLTQAIAAGTDIYQTYCIGCHGPNQDGNGPNAVSLDPKPQNLRNQPFMQALSYQRVWTSVHKGVPGTAMPRWENTLNDHQIEDVICYVLSLTAPVNSKGNFIQPSPKDLAGSAPAAQPGLGATETLQ